MEPRHFWCLVETLEKPDPVGLSDEDRGELLALLNEAQVKGQ
jgi:hypothetical protein